METLWPSGPLALNFTAIIVILLAPQADQGYPNAIKYFLAAVLAFIVKLAVLLIWRG